MIGIVTHVVASFLTLIALLVVLGFCLIGSALLSIECLPAFSEHLADLACIARH